MMDVLVAIDRALDGLCPCGADPAPGSAYCGDDCTPTHIGVDTDEFATPMRWRPGLAASTNPGATIRVDPEAMRRDHRLLVEACLASAAQAVAEALNEISISLRRLNRNAVAPAEGTDPMLQVIEQRRNRNTGPRQRQRAPRQINPHRGR